MDISQPASLTQAAQEALRVGREPKKVALWYAGLVTLVAVAVKLAGYVLAQQLRKATGLSNMGTNSLLSALQSMLPIAQMLARLCLDMGYLCAMLRISRKLYADHRELKEGLRCFGPALRAILLESLLYMAVGFAVAPLVSTLYLLTPLSAPALELLDSMPADPTALLLDEGLATSLLTAMLPCMILYVLAMLAVMLPVAFHFRMATYLITDHPGMGALAALRLSTAMMRRNCLKLLKVDLQLWWYHGLNLLVALPVYYDVLLPMLGIRLPFGADAAFLLFQGLYLVGWFAVAYLLRNRAELTYLMAYQSLLPKPKQEKGVVLGNIFQL